MSKELGEMPPNIIESVKPTITDLWTAPGESLSRSYHWEADGKNIYLYLNISKANSKGKDFLKVKANLDSQEIKGQGKYLWLFLKRKLQEIANGSVDKFSQQAVAHFSTPNQYSKYLLDSDSDYKDLGNGEYVAFFIPSQSG